MQRNVHGEIMTKVAVVESKGQKELEDAIWGLVRDTQKDGVKMTRTKVERELSRRKIGGDFEAAFEKLFDEGRLAEADKKIIVAGHLRLKRESVLKAYVVDEQCEHLFRRHLV
jgi:hypothetical protein